MHKNPERLSYVYPVTNDVTNGTLKDCLTPVPPLRGSTGGIEERVGGSLRRIASRSQTAGIRPHFARLRRKLTINARGGWVIVAGQV